MQSSPRSRSNPRSRLGDLAKLDRLIAPERQRSRETGALWAVWRSRIVSRLGGKRVDRPSRRVCPGPRIAAKESWLRRKIQRVRHGKLARRVVPVLRVRQEVVIAVPYRLGLHVWIVTLGGNIHVTQGPDRCRRERIIAAKAIICPTAHLPWSPKHITDPGEPIGVGMSASRT
jgi:hypothetical protein